MHVYPPEIQNGRDAVAQREPYFAALTAGRVHKWATGEDILAMQERDGLDEVWVCGFAFNDMGLCRLCNDYVIDLARRAPGRVRPLAVVPPLHRETEQEIARCHEAGCIGVGELFPGGQGWAIDDMRQTWRLAGNCDERGLHLLIHTAEQVGHAYPGKGDTGPQEAVAFATHHPEVQTVFAHLGGGLWLYETMPEVALTLANCWYDTAAAPYLYRPALFRAVEAAGAGHKLLYGSDFPLLGYGRYQELFGHAYGEEGPPTALLGGNARRLRDRCRKAKKVL